MKKIIVPTDFSEGAQNALEYATHLARLFHSSIEVVHAFSTPATGSAVMVDITDILKRNAEEELSNLKTKNASQNWAQGVSIEYRAMHGTVVEVVNRLSKSINAHFVVMGTHGVTGIAERLLGSNTAAAARNVEIPLFAIPQTSKFSIVKHILFSTDLKPPKEVECLHFLKQFADLNRAEISCIHVRKFGSNDDEAKAEKYDSVLAGIFKESKPRISYIYDNDTDEGIAEATRDLKPELLAVVRHDYSFFGGLIHRSVSQKIVSTTKIPILVLND